MKKLIIGIFVFFVLLLGAAFAVPYLFKDEILQAVKNDLNRKLTAKVDFDDVDISLWKHFPDLDFTLKNFRITETGPQKDITLADIGRFGMTLDIVKLFKGEKKIKAVELEDGKFHFYIAPDGTANYDIVRDEGEDTETEETELELEIEKFTADHIRMLYDDRSMDLKVLIAGWNEQGNIRLQDGNYYLTGFSEADTLDVEFDGVRYLKNVRTALEHEIGIENDLSTYVFRKMDARLNELPVTLTGTVDLKDEGILYDLQYKTAENSFRKLLSLVPAEYMPDLSGMEVNGTAALEGYLKGLQNDTLYPAYRVDFYVENGYIKSRELPEAIEKVYVKTLVDFPGGKNLDATIIDLPDIRFSIADNYAKGNLFIKNPMTDPWIRTAFKSDMDLSKLARALPFEDLKKLEGRLKADFSVKGRSSAMEKNQFDRVDAKGFFELKDFVWESDSLPVPVEIPGAYARVTPQALVVENTRILVGESDFALEGNVTNYLPYALQKDSVLKAKFVSRSQKIDFNELTALTSDDTTEETDTLLTAPEIPENLDIDLQAYAAQLIYKNMHLKDVESRLTVKDRKAELNTLLMKAFGGEMRMKGLYDTSEKDPYSRLDMLLDKVKIDQTAQSLSYLNYYTPVLKEVKGILNMQFGVGSRLDENLNPVYSTTDAKGEFSSRNIRPEHVEALKTISRLLKIKELENPTIDKVQARFEINKGTLQVKPFSFKINQIQSRFGGKVHLDRTLDMQWDMEIPVEMFGDKANRWLQNFQTQFQKWGIPLENIETVYVTILITGDVTHPQFKPVFKKGKGKEGLVETVQEAVAETVNDKVEEAQAQASAEAEKLIREAEAKGDALVKEAEAAAEKIRKEADIQAQKLIEQAKDPLSKLAAQKAAEKLRKEADKKARQLVDKAKREKEKLIARARQEAEALIHRSDSLKVKEK